jgi:hypothetical protein
VLAGRSILGRRQTHGAAAFATEQASGVPSRGLRDGRNEASRAGRGRPLPTPLPFVRSTSLPEVVDDFCWTRCAACWRQRPRGSSKETAHSTPTARFHPKRKYGARSWKGDRAECLRVATPPPTRSTRQPARAAGLTHTGALLTIARKPPPAPTTSSERLAAYSLCEALLSRSEYDDQAQKPKFVLAVSTPDRFFACISGEWPFTSAGNKPP